MVIARVGFTGATHIFRVSSRIRLKIADRSVRTMISVDIRAPFKLVENISLLSLPEPSQTVPPSRAQNWKE